MMAPQIGTNGLNEVRPGASDAKTKFLLRYLDLCAAGAQGEAFHQLRVMWRNTVSRKNSHEHVTM